MIKKKTKSLRPTYAFIDLKAFGHNIEVARKKSGSDILAVVKADGYGHGASRLAEYAWKNHNVKNFGVATVLEGMNLRNVLGNEPKILVLGYVDKDFYDEVAQHGLILNIFDYKVAAQYNDYLISNNLVADVSVKIDTGMHRLGFRAESFNIEEFQEKYSNLNIINIMSHLSSSDDNDTVTEEQVNEFSEMLERNKIDNIDTSMYNSSGICRFNNQFTLTRPGIMLYGYVYGAEDTDLKRVMEIRSKIVQIKELKCGESVSYGRVFTAEKNMHIGVVPIGYADGYPRCFTNRSFMLVNGVKCPVVGTVCMDMTMVDLSGVDLSAPELEVVVLGDGIDANYWAKLGNTINYEILCGISDRIPRIYLDE